MSWKQVVLVSVLVLAIAVCGVAHVIDSGHVALALGAILAWLVPSPIPGKPQLPQPGGDQ